MSKLRLSAQIDRSLFAETDLCDTPLPRPEDWWLLTETEGFDKNQNIIFVADTDEFCNFNLLKSEDAWRLLGLDEKRKNVLSWEVQLFTQKNPFAWLETFLTWNKTLKCQDLNNLPKILSELDPFISKYPVYHEFEFQLKSMAIEITSNALIHGSQKDLFPVEIGFGSCGPALFFSCKDGAGLLTKSHIIERWTRAKKLGVSPKNIAKKHGGGVGLYQALQYVDIFLHLQIPGKLSQIMGVFFIEKRMLFHETTPRSMIFQCDTKGEK